MSLSFAEFVDEIKLTKATSNLIVKEVLNEKGKNTNILFRGSISTTNGGFQHFHSTRGTHWSFYTNDYYFDSNLMSYTKNFNNLYDLKG